MSHEQADERWQEEALNTNPYLQIVVASNLAMPSKQLAHLAQDEE